MKIKPNFAFVLIFFSLLGAVKMRDLVVEERTPRTVAFPGDGRASIGNFQELREGVKEQGLGELLSGEFHGSFLAGGANPVRPWSPFWKVYYYTISSLFEPVDTYDVSMFLFFVMNAVCAFLAASLFGFCGWWRFLIVLSFVSLEQYYIRVNSHPTFAFYGPGFVTLGYFWRWQQDPSPRSSVILGLLCALTFACNEYYGFHGVLLLATMGILVLPWWHYRNPRFWIGAGTGALSFLVAMTALYPKMFLGRFLPNSTTYARHPGWESSEYEAYFLNDPWRLFLPSGNFMRAITPSWLVHTVETPEFAYPMGPIVLYVGLFVGGWLIWRFPRSEKGRLALLTWAGSLFAVFYCLRPEMGPMGLSMANIATTLGPMFRVSNRILIYCNMLMIILFFLCIRHLWDSIPADRKSPWKRAGLVVLVALCIQQFSQSRLVRAVQTLEYGFSPAVTRLISEPRGWLHRIPFHVHHLDPPEADADYLFEAAFHKKPSLASLVIGHATKAELTAISEALNRFNPELWQELGIRYVLAPKGLGRDHPAVEKYLTLGEEDLIYLHVTQPFSSDRFRGWLNQQLVESSPLAM